MIVSGKVLSVVMDVDYPKNGGGGSYQAYVLKYQDTAGVVKDLVKPMQGLKYKPTIKNVLSELKTGDAFQMELQKNDKGFIDVLAIAKGELAPEQVTGNSGASTGSTSGNGAIGKVLGSTYETPAERKVKQRLIVRQASINMAIALNSSGKQVPTSDVVLEQAEKFENWVYRGVE